MFQLPINWSWIIDFSTWNIDKLQILADNIKVIKLEQSQDFRIDAHTQILNSKTGIEKTYPGYTGI